MKIDYRYKNEYIQHDSIEFLHVSVNYVLGLHVGGYDR